jgi:hypothetical protein
VVGGDFVRRLGGRVALAPVKAGFSTTSALGGTSSNDRPPS